MSEKKVVKEELNFQRDFKSQLTMLPSKSAIFLRNCVLWQFIRFIILNLKMITVVGKSHH